MNDWYTPYECVVWTDITQYSNEDLDDVGDLPHYDWGVENLNDPNPGDFIIDYRTFYSICETGSSQCSDFYDNGVYCLDPNEMNYYFQSIIGIYSDFLTDNAYLDHRTSDVSLGSVIGDNTHYWWGCSVWFGVQNACTEGGYPTYLEPCCE